MVYEVYRKLPEDVRGRLYSALEGYEHCKHSPPVYAIGDTIVYSRELWDAGDKGHGPAANFHAIVVGVRFNDDLVTWDYTVIENPAGGRGGVRHKNQVLEGNITGLSDKPWYEMESSG
jgi:hypothetical protein